MSRILFSLLIALTFICCQNQSTNQENAPVSEPAAEEKPALQATLPSVPLDLLERIWNEGTQVDIIFYHHPFTLSMSEKPAIQHTVRHIAEEPAPINPNCPSTGRVTYQIDGDIVLEGDFYFSTGCTYYVFYENQEKKYANYMTNEGISYFNNQIQQATQMQQQMQRPN
jgi:hypothetical protein